ncbi:dihydrolipoamide acetyltransferase family protein [Streptomyces luteogriseus]|uniref:dihydrolipoamide acetyltransferase family protein n=1 Tax=Streptomyces luteogriseus TaxID=68233 RepID=UPI003788AAED
MADLHPVPEVAAGATEVVLAEWLVAPGDQLRVGDPIAVLATDKAVVDVESETGGVLLRQLAAAGSKVSVGAPMALVGTAEEARGDLDALLVRLGLGEAASALADAAKAEAESPAPPAGSTPPITTASQARDGDAMSPAAAQGGRLLISPIARRILREAGIDPRTVDGSGPGGRIRRRDVEAAIGARSTGTAATESSAPTTKVAPPRAAAGPTSTSTGQPMWAEVPHTRLRRAVANRLTQSKQQVPHFYLKRTARIDALVELRRELNSTSPVKISVNDLILRAVAVAHVEVPEANVIWRDEAMRQFRSVDIGVAIASRRGLVTPVLRGVEGKSLSAIAQAVRTFADQADEGRLQQADLEGGTITVTNLGMYGVDEFAAIINPPQSAILAVGAARPVAGIVDGQVRETTAMDLTLSVDHRAIDGALAARWFAALVTSLEQPLRLVV